MPELKKLFTPGKIGNLIIKNRCVLPPMQVLYGENLGYPGKKAIAYYEERAKGGCGLIIVEAVNVDEINNKPWNLQMSLADDRFIGAFQPLTEAIHKYDAKCFVQLHHYGAKSVATAEGSAWGCSEIPALPGGASPHAMTVDEIKVVEERFIAAAERAYKAGFDGVELAGTHGYLLHQFLSPYYNNRTDEYGGTLENCLRIYTEIIAGIKAKLGSGFPVSVRFPGDEFTPQIKGTRTSQDAEEIAGILESAGADCLNVSNGNNFNADANCEPYSYQPGWKKHVAKLVTESVSIPVIATNTIKDPQFAEQMLQEGVSDFVAIGRGQIADPNFMKKAKCGDYDSIRHCLGCMFCREQLYAQLPIKCAINPRVGFESEYPLTPEKDGEGKNVVVIGGGPAGMQAAVTMAKRGFNVTIFEKEDKLGGSMNLADKAKHKEKITQFIGTMGFELDKYGVKVVCGKEPSVDDIKALDPAGVIVAAGAEPIIPKVAGVDGENVVTAHDVISGKAEVKGSAIVIGAGMTGLECVEKLCYEGHKVAIVDMLDKVGMGMFSVLVNDMMNRLAPFKPGINLNSRLTAIKKDGVVVYDINTLEERKISGDTVILSLGVAPNTELYEEICASFDNVLCVGDNRAAGRIPHAIKDAYIKSLVFLKD